jgi:nitroreductase
MALVDNLKWCYATKRMNRQTVPQEKLDYILEAARFALSSSGFQPYMIFVISDRQSVFVQSKSDYRLFPFIDLGCVGQL